VAHIESWNGVSILRQQNLAHPDHEMWTDASGSWGVGIFWKSEWFQIKWPVALQKEQIAIKELVPITIDSLALGHTSQDPKKSGLSGTLRTGSNLLTLPGECAEIII